ncbi:hypothetical protein D3C80_2001200 [compost metagenome]
MGRQYALNILWLNTFSAAEKQVVQPADNSQLILLHDATIAGMEPALIIDNRQQAAL